MKATVSSTEAKTIYDLARVTGLSKTTVSSALSGNGRVSDVTGHAALDAARGLNYEGNYYAQHLKKRCSRSVALFSLNLDLGIGTRKIKLVQGGTCPCLLAVSDFCIRATWISYSTS